MSRIIAFFTLFAFVCFVPLFAYGQTEERILGVGYIHQVLDMNQSLFHGHNACAPTSAVSIIRHYHLQSDPPAGEPLGYYVYNPYPTGSADMSGRLYSNTDETCSMDMNASGQHIHCVYGAHGYMVFQDGSSWLTNSNYMRLFLSNHGLTVGIVQPEANAFQTIKNNIDNGLPLIGHIQTTFGHYLIVIGYHDEIGTLNDQIVVNDPYGDRNGVWNGTTRGEELSYNINTVTFLDVTPIYPVGIYEKTVTDAGGWKADGRSQAFVDKYDEYSSIIGYPNNNHPFAPQEGTPTVHLWNGVEIQDYRQPDLTLPHFGVDGQSALILCPQTFQTPPTTRAFLLKEGFWGLYKCSEFNGPGRLNAPSSEEYTASENGNAVIKQNFLLGTMTMLAASVPGDVDIRVNFSGGAEEHWYYNPGLGSVECPMVRASLPDQWDITFTSAPSGAEIWRDDIRVGDDQVTPFTVQLIDGTYSYTAKMLGYQDVSQEFTVTSEMTVSFTLAGTGLTNPYGLHMVDCTTNQMTIAWNDNNAPSFLVYYKIYRNGLKFTGLFSRDRMRKEVWKLTLTIYELP